MTCPTDELVVHVNGNRPGHELPDYPLDIGERLPRLLEHLDTLRDQVSDLAMALLDLAAGAAELEIEVADALRWVEARREVNLARERRRQRRGRS
jgi:hypothetical protein